MAEDERGPRVQKTVFRPSPLAASGLAGAAPEPAPAALAPAYTVPVRALPPADDVTPLAEPMRVRNPLMAAAARFLAICAAVQAERHVADAPGLLARALTELKAFERTAHGLGLGAEDLNRARYALAATLDDIVQNLPGGAAADWARQSVVVQAFGQAFGGDQFWTILDALLARPASNQDMLELFHACLAVGFQGRFRVSGDGQRQLAARMQAVHATLSGIRARPETDLVPAWRGVPNPVRRTSRWLPLIFAGGAMAALLLIVFLALKFLLDARDDIAWAKLRALPPTAPAAIDRAGPAIPAPDSTEIKRVRGRLTSPCITADDDGSQLRLTVSACPGLPGAMFDKGSERLAQAYVPILSEAVRALAPESGPIGVIAHTDSDPISSATFADNAALSVARAQDVAARLATAGIDFARLNPLGRGDREPLDRADTADAKARNRRVELTIARSE